MFASSSLSLRALALLGLAGMALCVAVPLCEGLTSDSSDGENQVTRRRVVPPPSAEAEIRTWTKACSSDVFDPTDRPTPNPNACEKISISAQGSSVRFHHDRAVVNCCTELSTQVEIDGQTIRILEQESGDLCYCECEGGFGAWISNLALGLYEVEVWSSQNELLCERTVRISKRDCLTEEDDGRTIHIRSGHLINLCLNGNPSTGYSWNLEELDQEMVRPLCKASIPSNTGLLGAPEELKWFFQAASIGETTMVLRYYRTWEGPDTESPTLTLHVVVH
jgi:predicted secreted protein